MEQPRNASGSAYVPGKVCLLLNLIYGAKQARQIWRPLFHTEVVRLGLKQSKTDTWQYIYSSGSGIVIIVVLVNNILDLFDSKSLLKDSKAEIKKLFQVKLLDGAKFFTGLELKSDKNGIPASQERYVENLLSE